MIPVDNYQFPEWLESGSSGGPLFEVIKIRQRSGFIYRVARHSKVIRTYDIAPMLRTQGMIDTIIGFFISQHGSARGFRFCDPFDNSTAADDISDPTVADQDVIFEAGQYRLVKTYDDGLGTGNPYIQRIFCPRTTGFILTAAGVTVSPTTYSVHPTKGIISFIGSPPSGTLKWGGRFDIPVHFDDSLDDLTSLTLSSVQKGDVRLTLEEVNLVDDLPAGETYTGTETPGWPTGGPGTTPPHGTTTVPTPTSDPDPPDDNGGNPGDPPDYAPPGHAHGTYTMSAWYTDDYRSGAVPNPDTAGKQFIRITCETGDLTGGTSGPGYQWSGGAASVTVETGSLEETSPGSGVYEWQFPSSTTTTSTSASIYVDSASGGGFVTWTTWDGHVNYIVTVNYGNGYFDGYRNFMQALFESFAGNPGPTWSFNHETEWKGYWTGAPYPGPYGGATAVANNSTSDEIYGAPNHCKHKLSFVASKA